MSKSAGVSEDNSLNREALVTATADILSQIETDTKGCIAALKDLKRKLKSRELCTNKGLSFLEMKNHTVLSYLISLSGLINEKVERRSIKGSPFIDHLVETRTVLEKIRPIDIKLKYKVDKLVRTAVEGKLEADPLRYKANPLNLSDDRNEDVEDESSSDEDNQIEPDPDTKKTLGLHKNTRDSRDGLYRPPRVAPQHFEERTSSKINADEKFKKRAVSSNIIRELQEEFLDTPIEIHNMGDAYAKRISREAREKETYEETYMTRLPTTKSDKHKERSLSTIGVLGDELTDFSGRGRSGKGTKRKSFGGKSKSRGRGIKKKFRK